MSEQEYYYEREKAEQERREDLADERNFWGQVFLTCLEESHNVELSIKRADLSLEAYKQRFS